MTINEAGKVAHYASLENLANILHDACIRMGAVDSMADPRESSLDWIQTIGYGHETSSCGRQQAESLKARVGQQLRLFCTADQNKTENNLACPIESSIYGRPRMWAQYAHNSTGFCLIIDREKFNNEILKVATRSGYLISGEIDYYEGLQNVFGGIELEHGVQLKPSQMFEKLNVNYMLQSIYFKKGVDWKDEQEYRWLLFNETGQPAFVSIRDAVKAVVLGWNFPPNQFSQAKSYCDDLNCECLRIGYEHPSFNVYKI